MKTKKNLFNLNPYELEIVPKGIIRANSNEYKNPILPQEVLCEGICDNLNYYPDEEFLKLERCAEKFYKTKTDSVVPLNGSDEGIDILIRTFCENGDKVVILHPTFVMYKHYASISSVSVVEFDVQPNDFRLDVDHFIDFCVKTNPKMVMVPNPLAPIGGIIKREEIEKIITSIPNVFVVVDEAYVEFSGQESMVNMVEKYKNLIVLRTVSKFFGLAGIRLGFIVSQWRSEILKVKSPYNLSSVTCKIGMNLFNNISPELISDRILENSKNREQMLTWLKQFSVVEKVYESHANFVFVRLSCEASDFANELLEKHSMQIKKFEGSLSKFVRISF